VATATPAAGFHEVRASGLTKLYGRHRALGGVDLTLRAGSLCALLGPNGAGKSTLLGILSTLVRPTSGKVVFAADGRELEPREVRAAIGVLAHEPMVYAELSALENLRFFGALYDVPEIGRRAAELLDDVGLDVEARQRPARTYSRGMLQRVSLARALLHQPRLLLLDEPFTGLDRAGAGALARTLAAAKRDGRIVLVVSHDLEAIAELCDHVVVLKRGKIVHDEPRPAPFGPVALKETYLRFTE
jgi:heme exporter protein A